MASSHGHSVAAWTTVTILFVASVVAGIAVVVDQWWLFWAGGGGITVVGLIVGKVMVARGLGNAKAVPHSPDELRAAAGDGS